MKRIQEPTKSRLAKNLIDNPAPPNVGAIAAAVGEDVSVVAAGILEGVRENGHVPEIPGIVHLRRNPDSRIASPGGIEAHRAKRVAEDISEQT